jgi:tRNA dimethylallyltransferase
VEPIVSAPFSNKMKKNKNKIVVILGPTATGKSGLAVKLARKYRGEVISADSRQVYKGLDIGTGKITKDEMQGIHHWLLDIVNPKDSFSVAQFQEQARAKIQTILKRSKLPIICGGTGFYIDSVVNNTVLPEVPPNKKLRAKLEKKSAEELALMLKQLDENRYNNIDINNKVRLVRAIEIATAIGKVPKIINNESEYNFLKIGLVLSNEDLRSKINKRLKLRIKQGMIEEAERLHKKGLSYERMRELGLEYRYLADFLEKKISKIEMISKLETEIWRYAKRQMTWFKKDKRIKWFNPKEIRKIQKEINSFLD